MAEVTDNDREKARKMLCVACDWGDDREGCKPVLVVCNNAADGIAQALATAYEEGWVAAKHDATPMIRAIQRTAYDKGVRGEEWEEPPPPNSAANKGGERC